jgi:hypothetical protein
MFLHEIFWDIAPLKDSCNLLKAFETFCGDIKPSAVSWRARGDVILWCLILNSSWQTFHYKCCIPVDTSGMKDRYFPSLLTVILPQIHILILCYCGFLNKNRKHSYPSFLNSCLDKHGVLWIIYSNICRKDTRTCNIGCLSRAGKNKWAEGRRIHM